MNKAKWLIKKIEEQQELSSANCEFYNEEGNVCETGAVRAMVNPGGECPFTSKFDSHQSSCTNFMPRGGVPDRRFHK